MAANPLTYYRNWSTTDTTLDNSTTTGTAKTIEYFGWSAPTGYVFKEWNTARNGTGSSVQPGEFTEAWTLYAIWELASTEISKIIIPDGTEYDIKDATARTDIASKQDTLVSGTNIKTINGESVLGSGNITISSGSAQNIWYGTCATGASTQTKVVDTTTDDFTLTTGNMVRVKFTNAQTYNGGIKLNVDGTGAVNVMRQGTTVTVRYFYLAGEVVDFVYDGTNFVAVNEGIATTTYYGVTKLSNSTNSTSTSLSATANSVKLAYDLADSKSIVSVSQTLTSGTEIGSVTVDGTATTLYAPSGGSADEAMTTAEVDTAVENAFTNYAISVTNAEAHSTITNERITQATYGQVVLVSVSGGATQISSISSTPSVTFTRLSSTKQSFIMPNSAISIDVTISAGGGDN